MDRGQRLVSFDWLVRLRWIAGAAQGILVGGSALWPASELPVLPMLGIVAAGLLSNLALALRWRGGTTPPEGVLFAVMLLDTALLTGLLGLSGGASNPFSVLYLLVVGLAAMLLSPPRTWAVVGASAAAYAALFLLPGHHHHPGMRTHLVGMWVAFALGAPFLAFGITRIRRELARAERRVARAREAEQRADRLASLATLAAGAAHELSTPLSTIAVVAGELARADDDGVREDAALLRREVDRCRHVLRQLTVDSGAGMGEGARAIPVVDLLADAVGDRDVPVRGEGLEATVCVPPDLVAQALRRLIDNAVQADPAGVEVRVAPRGEGLDIAVIDRGPGMDAATRQRAGEPFFTTRRQGEGRGLGLFFARSVVEHLGGRLELHSEPGRGTRAVVHLPPDRVQPR